MEDPFTGKALLSNSHEVNNINFLNDGFEFLATLSETRIAIY
jgi:hypothetical protein